MAKAYAKDFYLSRAWIKCRRSYLDSVYHICERCQGIATIVHHRKHISPKNINDSRITLSFSNLEALCHDCHNKEHISNETIPSGLRFDENGDLVKMHPPGVKG